MLAPNMPFVLGPDDPVGESLVESLVLCVVMNGTFPLEDASRETIAADSLSSDMTGALSAGLLLKWAQPPLCVLYRGRQCLPGSLQVRCLAIQVLTCVVRAPACSLHACLKPVCSDCVG